MLRVQGLYKSTLICPMEDCQYHSIKFDPFMYLSLPLPDRRTRSFQVTVVHVDGSQAPTRYTVTAPITGQFIRHLAFLCLPFKLINTSSNTCSCSGCNSE